MSIITLATSSTPISIVGLCDVCNVTISKNIVLTDKLIYVSDYYKKYPNICTIYVDNYNIFKCNHSDDHVYPAGIVEVKCQNKIFSMNFKTCINLMSIVLPMHLKRIEQNSFIGCLLLKSVVIPDSVEEIENWAFEGCSKLKRVKLSRNCKKIGCDIFKGCTLLESITILNSIIEICDLRESIKLIAIPKHINIISNNSTIIEY